MGKTICTPYFTAAFPVIQEWNLGDNALIQCVTNPGTEYETTEFMSGKDADEAIENDLVYNGSQIESLVTDGDGCVYGYVWKDGYVTEFWDCDEQSWSEYVEENEL